MPSVVMLREDGEVLVGEAAERRALTAPARTAREFKRRLGDPTPLMLGGAPYGAEALMAQLLRHIVARITEQRGELPERVAVTHPASYGEYKLDLLRQAIRQANVLHAALLSEPQAAALDYVRSEQVELGDIVAVYDFGGGTFDAAVLRRTEHGFTQLGEPEGLERLGGIDFDEALFRHVARALGGAVEQLDPTDAAAQAALARLREECRLAKEALSDDTDATIPVTLPDLQTEVRVTRGEFEEMVRPRLGETVEALERAVRSAGLEMGQLSRVLLVGGSSRIPLVAEMVRARTGLPVALDAHPKHAIALGAAGWAANLASEAPDAPDADAVGTIAPIVVPSTASTASTARRVESVPTAPPTESPAAGGVPPVVPGAPSTARAAGDGGWWRFMGAVAAAVTVVVLGLLFMLRDGDRGGSDSGAATSSPSAGHSAASSTASGTPRSGASETATPRASAVGTSSSTPTAAPPAGTAAGRDTASITTISVVDSAFSVAFQTSFSPALPGQHVHFFFDTVPPVQAGVPGTGPWELYAGPSPFRGYKVSDRPAGATALCILVANADHSVRQGTGNCVPLNSARITGIEVSGSRYSVAFETTGYVAQVPGQHVHFFFDTVPPVQAGVPGAGPWILYGGASPFTGYSIAERPARAQRMCILVATPDHAVHANSGNCVALPGASR